MSVAFENVVAAPPPTTTAALDRRDMAVDALHPPLDAVAGAAVRAGWTAPEISVAALSVVTEWFVRINGGAVAARVLRKIATEIESEL